jgi:hypothetical protein
VSGSTLPNVSLVPSTMRRKELLLLLIADLISLYRSLGIMNLILFSDRYSAVDIGEALMSASSKF